MRLLRSALILLALSAWAAGPLAGAAGAGALAPTYQSSDPEDGAMLDHPPSEVTVTFSEPLDESSVMSVFDECGDEIDSGPATASLNELTVGIGETPGGTYKVVYTAVGLAGVTGQSNGSFDFMVHHGKSCKGEPGGHGNHGKGKGKGKGHGNHGNNNDDDHDDHDSMSDDHSSGSDHSGSSGTHDSGTHDSDNHTSGTGHSDGMNGDGHGKHGEHGDGRDKAPGGSGPGTQDGDANPPVASGPGGAPVRADVQAMLVGLGLALAVGVLGGWLLRTTGGLFDPA